jgi:transposase
MKSNPSPTTTISADFNIETKVIGHLGIVAGVMDDLNLVSGVDELLQGKRDGQKISMGQRIKALILNLTAFENQTLYHTPRFLYEQAYEALLGNETDPHAYNDDALGRALDEIYSYGPTKFFQTIAMKMMAKTKLGGNSLRLDSTSLMLQGDYKNSEDEEFDDGVRVTFGHSKDGRPDLKQIMLSLVTTGVADLPVLAKPQSGNASDKTEFSKIVDDFQQHFKTPNSPLWIFDSAGYKKGWLESQKKLGARFYPWLTRIPETILCAKKIVNGVYHTSKWEDLSDGYRSIEFRESYGGIDQLWTLYFSEQAYQKESKTLLKNVENEKINLEKKLWHLSKKEFGCEKDAEKQAELIMKKSRYHKIDSIGFASFNKHAGVGRPKRNECPTETIFKVTTNITPAREAIDRKLNSCGRFILGTNAVDIQFTKNESDTAPKVEIVGSKENSNNQNTPEFRGNLVSRSQLILDTYKELQGTESAFKLIKDREFMMNRFFLKKESRIEALLVVIALAIFVFNYTSYFVGDKLKKAGVKLNNPNGTRQKKNTIRNLFDIFKHISAYKIVGLNGPYRMSKLSDVQQRILAALGPPFMVRYGLSV